MKTIPKLTKRQQYILQVIENLEEAQTNQIVEKVSENFDTSSRITIIRDINHLKKNNLIKQFGKGRSVYYKSNTPSLEKPFNIDQYFETDPDRRIIKTEKLKFTKPQNWLKIITENELKLLTSLTKTFQKRLAQYTAKQIKRELERITIEFSWKSSHIEGNTYTLLDTERLIKEHKEAEGKTHLEAVMILNHKSALEYVWNHAKQYKTINLKKIEEIHELISSELGITKGFRKRPVGIVGTAYKPYDNNYQIKEAVESLCKLLNKLENPFLKALIGVAGLSYIQPFEDGNKRTSRLLGNAILLAYDYCPISYRSVEEIDYKKAIILFYEQHSIIFFKELFIEQYHFATQNYFQ
jgi:Fic family protein